MPVTTETREASVITVVDGIPIFTNPNNAAARDGVTATVVGDTEADGSDVGFYATGFGFTLNPLALVDGIKFTVRRKCSHNSATKNCTDITVRLVVDGAQVTSSTNQSHFPEKWPTSLEDEDYPAASGWEIDRWNTPLTGAQINGDFGLYFRFFCLDEADTGLVVAEVDSVECTLSWSYMPQIPVQDHLALWSKHKEIVNY